HAVMAVVQAAGGDNDHFAFGLGQVAGLFHDGVVIGKKCPELIRAVCQHQKHVWNEAGLLVDGFNAFADIFWKGVKRADGRKTAYGGIRVHNGSGKWLVQDGVTTALGVRPASTSSRFSVASVIMARRVSVVALPMCACRITLGNLHK